VKNRFQAFAFKFINLYSDDWVPKLHAGLLENLGRYRRYKPDEVGLYSR
jgi:hypothetical protein